MRKKANSISGCVQLMYPDMSWYHQYDGWRTDGWLFLVVSNGCIRIPFDDVTDISGFHLERCERMRWMTFGKILVGTREAMNTMITTHTIILHRCNKCCAKWQVVLTWLIKGAKMPCLTTGSRWTCGRCVFKCEIWCRISMYVDTLSSNPPFPLLPCYPTFL